MNIFMALIANWHHFEPLFFLVTFMMVVFVCAIPTFSTLKFGSTFNFACVDCVREGLPCFSFNSFAVHLLIFKAPCPMFEIRAAFNLSHMAPIFLPALFPVCRPYRLKLRILLDPVIATLFCRSYFLRAFFSIFCNLRVKPCFVF